MNKLRTFLVTLLLVIPFIVIFSPPVGAVWYDGDWGFRKEITITNNLDDYQSRINISYDGGGDVSCEGNCNSNFSDIRFALENKTELPFWFEEKVDGSFVHLWVRNIYNDSTIYLYYNNTVAPPGSNMSNTWHYSDDWATDRTGDLTYATWHGDRIHTYEATTGLERTVRLLAKYNVYALDAHDYAGFVGLGFANNIDYYTNTNSVNFWLSADKNSQGATDTKYGTYIRSEDAAGNSVHTSTTTDQIDKDVDNYRKAEMTLNSSSAKVTFRSTYWDTILDTDEVTTNLPSTVDMDEFCYFTHSQDTAGHHFWDYDGPNERIKTGGERFTNAGMIKAAYKWVCLGIYTDGVEPSFSFDSEENFSGNNCPNIEDESPSDGETGVAVDGCTIQVNISDAEGDTFNYTVYFNGEVAGAENNVGNDTYDFSVSVDCGYNTYDWSVNVTNGVDWNNKSFSFTTETCVPTYTTAQPDNEYVCPGYGDYIGLCVTNTNDYSYNITFYEIDAEEGIVTLATYTNVLGQQCTSFAVTYGTTYQWSFLMSEYGNPSNYVESPTYTFVVNTEEGCASTSSEGGGSVVYMIVPLFFIAIAFIFMKIKKKEEYR